MAGLLLLEVRTAEAARSPELRYLASMCLTEARRVFGRVDEVVWRPALRGGSGEIPALRGGSGEIPALRGGSGEMPPGDAEPSLPEGELAVLVIGADNVYLGAQSLRRMKSALEAGAGVVLPDSLAEVELGGHEPLYTLRDFEELEQRLLDQGFDPRERRRSHLPVALFSPAFFAGELSGLPVATLLSDRRLLARRGLEGQVAHAGLFYPFIDYYGEVRADVLPYLPQGVGDVLEVGCGRGATGAYLQQRLGCRVTGVELNPEVARSAAERLHRVIVGDVESLTFDEHFDAVVATELFEHLAYPESFLAKMKPLLRPGGRIVLSVPNVGHYSIVEDLLAGRWDYVPMGLLCYTHLRFFTRATLEHWAERAGFSSCEIVAQKTELPERFARLSSRHPSAVGAVRHHPSAVEAVK